MCTSRLGIVLARLLIHNMLNSLTRICRPKVHQVPRGYHIFKRDSGTINRGTTQAEKETMGMKAREKHHGHGTAMNKKSDASKLFQTLEMNKSHIPKEP